MREQSRLAVAIERHQRVPEIVLGLGQLLRPLLIAASIALAEAQSASPGAWALKVALLAKISRQGADDIR